METPLRNQHVLRMSTRPSQHRSLHKGEPKDSKEQALGFKVEVVYEEYILVGISPYQDYLSKGAIIDRIRD